MNEDIKEKISKLSNEDELRELREYADARLQQVKDEKAIANKEVLEAKYKDKYLVIYGSDGFKIGAGNTNKNDIKIVHVLDISFVGRRRFRCHAKVIHIQYDSESTFISHLTANGFNEIRMECFEDAQFDLDEANINEIIDENQANKMIADAKKYQKEIMKNWNL